MVYRVKTKKRGDKKKRHGGIIREVQVSIECEN